MNRQMKRMQERQERKSRGSVTERRESATTSARRGAGSAPAGRSEGKKKRTGARQFLKEVRQELRKVDWPSRRELISYTVVVLVTVVVMTSFVFFLDLLFSKVILNVLAN
jgi:preprotein translocase subunit SecE